jgi:methionyl-tRNA formyltransferase
LATYTCKRTLADNQIKWQSKTKEIYNLIRAVSQPYPGAFSYLSGEKIRIWSAQPIQVPPYIGRVPGRVIQVHPGVGSVVLTGDGALLLKEAQRERGDIECAAAIFNRLSQTLGGIGPGAPAIDNQTG